MNLVFGAEVGRIGTGGWRIHVPASFCLFSLFVCLFGGRGWGGWWLLNLYIDTEGIVKGVVEYRECYQDLVRSLVLYINVKVKGGGKVKVKVRVEVEAYSLVSRTECYSPDFTQLRTPGHGTCSFLRHLNSPGSIQPGCHFRRTELFKHTSLHCSTRYPLTPGSRECTCGQSALPRSTTPEHKSAQPGIEPTISCLYVAHPTTEPRRPAYIVKGQFIVGYRVIRRGSSQQKGATDIVRVAVGLHFSTGTALKVNCIPGTCCRCTNTSSKHKYATLVAAVKGGTGFSFGHSCCQCIYKHCIIQYCTRTQQSSGFVLWWTCQW